MHYFRKKENKKFNIAALNLKVFQIKFLFLLLIITICGLLMMSVGIKSIFKWQ